ncbi:hypothetical protein PV11_02808 [Exophiala sideris]|uniref:Uncharacterized protein n=1 Tax=Exophiala sideris TaxID=1016849 RepID=A0A0D1XGG5_9EURO|nr:hypothetical protein PV11_02808 [Exophiala sideris]
MILGVIAINDQSCHWRSTPGIGMPRRSRVITGILSYFEGPIVHILAPLGHGGRRPSSAIGLTSTWHSWKPETDWTLLDVAVSTRPRSATGSAAGGMYLSTDNDRGL